MDGMVLVVDCSIIIAVLPVIISYGFSDRTQNVSIGLRASRNSAKGTDTQLVCSFAILLELSFLLF